MTTIDKLATGVPGLDTLTHGGIPAGRATLVVGKAGTGKTILGLQIISAAVEQGRRAVIVAVEESPEDLVTTASTLGLSIEGAVAGGSVHMIDVTRPTEGPTMVSGSYDLAGLVHRLEASVAELGATVVLIDSATALFSPKPPPDLVRALFFQLIGALRRLKVSAIILAESPTDYGPLTTLGVEEFLCDTIVVLRNIVDFDRRRRTIEINKYRRSAHFKGEYSCTITNRGLAIFPIEVREREQPEQIERFSSGLPGLDEMTHGGWLRNAIIIVRGPTGSGKTMLSGLYARAGGRRGERVMHYGFEEPRHTLLRNFDAIGLEFSPLVSAGLIRVVCRYPEAISLEDLLVDIRLGLEEFKPSLIVIDSISSIEHASSEKGFRQFMIGMASILRDHGRSALLTQTVAAGESATHSAPFLSTIADAILTMDYSPETYDLNRRIRVLKMRGSAHSTHPYHLRIEAGGLRVESMTAS
jgi:circadian clock protein KaiC